MFLALRARCARTVQLALAAALSAPLAAQGGTVITEVEITPPLGVGDQNWPSSITSIGDLDGDGVDDLAVGHKYDPGAGAGDEGSLWILFMNADRTVDTAVEIDAVNPSGDDEFGAAVSWLGDLDGAGGSEATLAVGAPGTGSAGAVHLLFLNASGGVDSSSLIDGNDVTLSAADGFGVSVATIGDVDGPGGSEQAIAVGARGDGIQNRGAVHVVFLDGSGNVTDSEKIVAPGGSLAFDQFGDAVAGLGDLDGDGVPDLAVGHPLDAGEDGAVHILFLESDGTVAVSPPQQKILGFDGVSSADGFGRSVTAIDDLDGDGVQDLLVGADLDSFDGNSGGSVWSVFLNTDGTVSGMQRITEGTGGFAGPLDTDAHFGSAVATLGDLDGDFRPDIAVCASDPTTFPSLDLVDGEIWMLELEINTTAATTWTGTNGSNWDDPGNWSNGVPSAFTALTTITDGSNPCSTVGAVTPTTGPLILEAPLTVQGSPLQVIGDLSVIAPSESPGALGGGNLVVNETITVTGNLGFSDATNSIVGTGTFDVEGNVSLFSGASFGVPTPNIEVAGNWLSEAVSPFPGGTVTFDGSGQSITAILGADTVYFFDLQVSNGSVVTANDDLVVNGDLTANDDIMCTGAIDVDGTVSGAASATIDTTALTVGGDLDFEGSYAPGLLLTFDGTGLQAATDKTLPDVVVNKPSGTATLHGCTADTFELASGELSLTLDSFVITGDANFNGGSLTGTDETLAVGGNTTFAGTTVLTPPEQIQVNGNWTSDSNFNPTSGSVFFVSLSPPQTLSGAGLFYTLETGQLGPTSVIVQTPLTVSGDFRTLPLGAFESGFAIDVAGNVDLSAGALTLNAADITIEGDCDFVNSTIAGTGRVVLDGTGPQQLEGDVQVQVEINKASGTVTVPDGVSIFDLESTDTLAVTNGELVLASGAGADFAGFVSLTGGTLDLESGATLQGATFLLNGSDVLLASEAEAVFDNALAFQAGSVDLASGATLGGVTCTFDGAVLTGTGTLDLTGDLTINSSPGNALPDIALGGNWLDTVGITPTTGRVTCTAPFLTLSAQGGTLGFHDLEIPAGTTTVVDDDIVVGGDLQVDGIWNSQALVGVDVDGDLSGGVGGQLSLVSGGGGNTFAGDVAFFGSITGGPVTLDGGSQNVLDTVNLPSTIIDASTVNFAGTHAIQGDLSLVDGTMQVVLGTTVQGNLIANSATAAALIITNGVLRIDGTATINEGTFLGNGVLDLDGPASIGANAQFEFGATELARLEVSGALDMDATLAETTVVFDGSSPQTVTGSPSFFHVEVDPTADVTVGSVPITGDLVVEGAFDGNDIVVGGEVSGSGTFDVSSKAQFLGDFTFDGTMLAAGLNFAGSDQLVTSPNLPIVVQSAPGGTLTFGDGASMDTLNLVSFSGNVVIATDATVAVNTSAQLEGGTLSGDGTLQLLGDAVFNGTVVNSPDMEIAGDLTVDENWSPMSGTVTFNGAGGQNIFLGGTAVEAPFFAMTVVDGTDVTAGSGVPLYTASTLTIAGDLTLDGGIDADGEVTGPSTGSLTIAPPIQFGGGFSLEGSLNTSAMVIFDGSGPNFVTVDTDFDSTVDVDMEVGGVLTFSANQINIDGDLNLEEGDLVVTVNNTTDVTGNANFNGGSLSGLGTVIAAGQMTFAGTTMNSPDLEVGGDFSHDENFAPQSGTVTFTGSSPQEISTTGAATAATFYGLFTATGSVVSSMVEVQTDGPTTIDTGSSLTVAADVKFGHNLVVKGSLNTSTMVIFDGGGFNTIEALPPATLPTVDVDKDMGGGVTFQGAQLNVDGLLNVLGGTLEVADGTTVGVAGDGAGSGVSTFSGGFLRSEGSDDVGSGVIDFAEDVRFEGTSVTTPPDIELEGHWSSDENFLPTLGLVTFDGLAASPQDLTINGAAAEARFHQLKVEVSARVEHSAPIHALGDCDAEGQLICTDPNEGTLVALDVDEQLTGSGTIDFGSTPPNLGGMTFSGTVANLPAVKFDGSGANVLATTVNLPTMTVSGTGTLTITSDLDVTGDIDMAGTGTLVASTGAVDATGDLNLSSGAFVLEAGNTTTVDIADMTGGAIGGGGTLVTTSELVINTPGMTVMFDGDGLEIDKDLRLVDGTLEVTGNTTTIGGTATFQGGALAGDGLLDIAGDVTFEGTTATAPPSIELEGNWDVDANWAPTTGTVTFDGPPTQTVTSDVSPALFYGFCVLAGSTVDLVDPVQIDGPFTVDGTVDVSLGADLNGGLSGTGTLTIDAGSPLEVGGDFTFVGNLTGESDLILDGAGAHVVNTNVVFTDVTFDSAGSYSVQAPLLLIANDLEIADGDVTFESGTTTFVANDANFLGGSLASAGSVTVGQNVTFAGTSVPGDLTLSCLGDWDSDASFSPTGGLVTFAGSGVQSVTTAQTDFEWAGLTIDTNSEVTTGKDVTTLLDLTVKGTLTADSATSVTVGGTLDVDGAFSASSASLDVGGDFLLDPAGALTTGGTLYGFGGDYLEEGTFTHPGGATVFTFDSDSPRTISATADQDLPGISLQGTGAVSLDSGGTTTIGGDFTLAAASSFGTEDALVIAGDASFTGGAWDGTSSPIDVAGHVTFASTVATGSHDIDCGGDWSADAQFAPSGGTVTLDGVGDTTVTGAGLFRDLVVANGKRTVVGVSSVSTDSISIGVGAELDLGTRSTEVAVGPLTVDGALRVGSGGELVLASSVAADVSTTGTLSLLSTFPQEAAIRALGAPGYSFSVAGGLEAMNFRIQEMDASGFVIEATATIAAAPNDFRGGVFDLPSSTPGSVLLDVSQAVPTTFQYLTFEDTLGQGTSNVRTTPGSADIAFQNFAGAFAGEAFDDDGLDQIDWLPPSTSAVSSFEATPEPGRVVLEWTSTTEIDNVAWAVRRQRVGGTAMVTVGEVVSVGPSSYRLTDHVVLGNTEYTYFLDERLTHGALQEIASTTTKTKAVSPTQPRLFQVQSMQGANAIADTLARVLLPDSTLVVGAGAYNAFTITGDMPPGLRVVASEPGVVIHTAAGPVTLDGLVAGQAVELAGLTLAAPPTDQPALLIRDSHGVVLLDELTARGGLDSPAVRIEHSERIAIQAPDFEPSLHASGTSALSIRGGAIGTVLVGEDSDAVLTGVATSVEAGSGSTWTELEDPLAQLSFERSAEPGELHEVLLEAPAGSGFALLAAGGLGWLDAGFPAADALLLDGRRALLVEVGFAAASQTPLGLPIPSAESFAERSWLMQALILDPFAAEARLTNVRSLAVD